jgi:hypothetical protein
MAKKKTSKKKASVGKSIDSNKLLIIAGILAIILTWITTPIQEILLTLVGIVALVVGSKKKGSLRTATLIAGVVTVLLAWVGFRGADFVLTLAGLTMIVAATRK